MRKGYNLPGSRKGERDYPSSNFERIRRIELISVHAFDYFCVTINNSSLIFVRNNHSYEIFENKEGLRDFWRKELESNC